ncbi:hypothetical protein LCGC14_1983320, partial [marine sediment metagenome]
EYQATSVHGEGDTFFAKLLAEKTKGQIVVTLHFGGALGYKSKDHLDAVGDGAIPIADTYVGALGGIDSMFLLPSLPFLAATTDSLSPILSPGEPRALPEVHT